MMCLLVSRCSFKCKTGTNVEMNDYNYVPFHCFNINIGDEKVENAFKKCCSLRIIFFSFTFNIQRIRLQMCFRNFHVLHLIERNFVKYKY